MREVAERERAREITDQRSQIRDRRSENVKENAAEMAWWVLLIWPVGCMRQKVRTVPRDRNRTRENPDNFVNKAETILEGADKESRLISLSTAEFRLA